MPRPEQDFHERKDWINYNLAIAKDQIEKMSITSYESYVIFKHLLGALEALKEQVYSS